MAKNTSKRGTPARKQPTPPAPPQHPATIQASVGPEDNSQEFAGILAGDQLNLVLCEDPRPGETVLLRNSDGVLLVRRVIRGAGEKYGPQIDAAGPDDLPSLYPLSEFAVYRVAEIKRTIRPERPSEQGEEGAEPAAPSHEARERIVELRERLDTLYEPEQERAYFKTLREIWDLEHPMEVAGEWPEIIGEGVH